MTHVDVTIIVGAFNQDQWLAQAVYSAENQIVPEGCTGALPSFHVMVSTDKIGVGASVHRNEMIRKANSDWIIWLDADDLLPSHYLYYMWRSLRWGRTDGLENRFFGAPMQFITGCRLDLIPYVSVGNHKLPFGMSCMFSKEQWAIAGMFDEDLLMRSMEDLDMWLTFVKKGFNCEMVPQTFALKRDFPDSFLKRGEANKDATLALFNRKHGMDLKSKVLPYWIPSTTIL